MELAEKKTTKEDIIKTAAVLFAQKGYFGVSMGKIAKEVKITKAGLYYYFQSKEELYFSILKKTFGDLKNTLSLAIAKERFPLGKLEAIIEAYLTFTLQRPETELLWKQDSSFKFRQEILGIFVRLLRMIDLPKKLTKGKIYLTASFLLSTLTNRYFISSLNPKRITKNILSLFFPKIGFSSYKREEVK